MSSAQENSSSAALDPLSRISEILFGLIMVLSFTCSMEIAEVGREDIREILLGAVGCNLAWGIIDAFFYLMNLAAERGREKRFLKKLATLTSIDQVRDLMHRVMPESVVGSLTHQSIMDIKEKLLTRDRTESGFLINFSDVRAAFFIFALVFLSTFPVSIPFIVMSDAYRALRISNAIALLLLFSLGYWLGSFAGRRAWLWGGVMVLIGSALVSMTIALGG